MNQRTISQLSFFWLVIVLAIGISNAFTVISKPFRKNYVRIINDLGNIKLVFHCKSKDDDLGLRGVKPAAYWEFSFRQNVFASTLFFCNFWYTNFDKITFHAAFVVFKSDFEFVKECGGDYCMWIAKVDGLYKYNLQTKMAVKKYDWQRAVMNDVWGKI